MKKIKEFHSPVYEYLKVNRGVGNTTLIKDGALNAQYPFIVLGADMTHAKEMTRQFGNRFAIPASIQQPDCLRARNEPVLIDNYVFTRTCEGYIATIRDYREQNKELHIELLKKNGTIDAIKNIPFWIRLFGPLFRRRIKYLDR